MNALALGTLPADFVYNMIFKYQDNLDKVRYHLAENTCINEKREYAKMEEQRLKTILLFIQAKNMDLLKLLFQRYNEIVVDLMDMLYEHNQIICPDELAYIDECNYLKEEKEFVNNLKLRAEFDNIKKVKK